MYLDNYKIFKTFRTNKDAEELKRFFDKKAIPSDIIDNSHELIGTFYTGDEQQQPFQFLIPTALFEKATKILQEEAEENLQNIPHDYYLYSFSNDELYDIILKPDEWGELDYVLSKKILKERGISLNEATLTGLNNKRLEDLRKPDNEYSGWITAAYICALLGGLLGIILGHYFWNGKKTLPNGERVYRYSTRQRKHGKNIFILGIIFFILWILIRLFVDTLALS